MISVGSVVRVYPGPPCFVLTRCSRSYDRCAPDGPRHEARGALPLLGGVRLALADVCSLILMAARLFGVKPEWGFSSAGRAPALQAGGQRFDPVKLHHFFVLTLSRSDERCAPDGPRHKGAWASGPVGGGRMVLCGSKILVFEEIKSLHGF